MGLLDSLKKMFGGAPAEEQPQDDSSAAPAEEPAQEAAPAEDSPEKENREMAQ